MLLGKALYKIPCAQVGGALVCSACGAAPGAVLTPLKGARVSISFSVTSGGGHPQHRPRAVRRVLLGALARELERLREGAAGDVELEACAAQVAALVSAFMATLPPSYVGEPLAGEGVGEGEGVAGV